MYNHTILEKPNVLVVLTTSLSLLATITIYLLVDTEGTVQIPQDRLIQITGAALSILLGLSSYSYSLSKKLSKKADRKERIQQWRHSLENQESDSIFQQSQTCIELNDLLTKKEITKKSIQTKDTSIHIDAGAFGYSENPSDREYKFYHQVISRIERQWGII